ncbi:MAG: TolC family protein [Lachnospiraceae bacterium]|nr:TolC family protein [Lachnospiraceae bacterium]
MRSHMKRSRSIRLTALAVAGILAAAPLQALAGAAPSGPGAEPELPRYTAEQLARLQDNVLEYDEINDRVREYNPTISELWKTYEDSREDYKNILTEMESQTRLLEDEADEYFALGDFANGGVLTYNSGVMKSSVKSIRDMVNKWDNDTNKNSSELRKVQKKVVAGVQSAVIGYDTIRQNIATLEAVVQLSQKQYEIMQHRLALGLVTEKEVLSAKNGLLSAQSQLMALQNQQDSTRRTICLLLGYDSDSNPDIRPVPEFDINRLAGMNLEADTKKAIGNNYTLIGQRTSAEGKTNSQTENRSRIIDEGDQKLTIEMQRLYQEVQDKKAAYDAAVTGLAAGESNRGAAERMYQNGLTSEADYVGQMLSYYQKKAAKESANLNLWQAMETYDWAIDGQATVE